MLGFDNDVVFDSLSFVDAVKYHSDPNIISLNETFMIEVVDQAKEKLEKYVAELDKLQKENSELRVRVTELEVGKLSTKIGAIAVDDGKNMRIGDCKTAIQSLISCIKNSGTRKTLEATVNQCQDVDSLSIALRDVSFYLKKEVETANVVNKDFGSQIEKLKMDKTKLEQEKSESENKAAALESTIKSLEATVRQCESDLTTIPDMEKQVETMKNVTRLLEDKIRSFENVSIGSPTAYIQKLFDNNNAQQKVVQSLIEDMANQLNTEVYFTNHLNKTIEKLNVRKTEQDKCIKELGDRIKARDIKIIELERERSQLKTQVEEYSKIIEEKTQTLVDKQYELDTFSSLSEQSQIKLADANRTFHLN